ncbi:MAG: DUF721 domain-containing protein [Thiomargarita sp.]|nr:DUF721 domain-containing protein [Thiomargarita sp.]
MKSFSQLLTSSSDILCKISQHSHTIQQINSVFQNSLPTPLNSHCHVANLREQILIIYTDSSIWATWLRYMTPELKQKWQKNQFMPPIQDVVIKVYPL